MTQSEAIQRARKLAFRYGKTMVACQEDRGDEWVWVIDDEEGYDYDARCGGFYRAETAVFVDADGTEY